MKNEEYLAYSAKCFRDCESPCASACPLGVNVRGMVEKMRVGNFSAAYRLLRQHVLYPDIVSRICPEPCRQTCVRKNHDESIHIKMLETACIEYTKNRRPAAFQIPKKPYTIAVIGAGLSGLSCALKLAMRNYGVRVYCRSEKPGGRLADHLSEQIYLDELALQFEPLEYEHDWSRTVVDLDSISADAIYIATGAGGDDFGLSENINRDSLGTSRQGVFMGGGLLGAGPIEAIEHRIRAAKSIEIHLKTGSMEILSSTHARHSLNENFYRIPVNRSFSTIVDDKPLGRDSAMKESDRCLLCNCSQCRKNCEMMEYFRIYPKKITADIVATTNAIESLTDRVAQRLVNSCTQCGMCREVCPESVDMEGCILQARRDLHKNGSLPAAFHDYWLRDMHHANNEAGFLYIPTEVSKCAYLFFPGCQLGASDSAYVTKTYEFLLTVHPSTALMQACCGAPAEWAGDEELRDQVFTKLRDAWGKSGKPKFIVACPTCQKTFNKYFPESETLSLYTFLSEHWKQPVSFSGQVMVYDSCASRDAPEMSRGVRLLADRAGMRWHEVEGEPPRCCSYGGNIYSANPSLVSDIIAKRIQTYGELCEYLCYCANCRDTFARAGRHSRHILDFLFIGNPAARPAPSLTERRNNRMMVKKHYYGGTDVGEPIPERHETIRLIITQDISRKMDELLVLEEDVRTVIYHCEATGEKICHSESGAYTGHFRNGVVTYWVKYRSQDVNTFRVDNIYVHRMEIEEA